MPKGYHIVLEGPDASGKKTQSELLVAWLGEKAVRHAYPRYSEPYGMMVTEYLQGKAPSDDPYYVSLLYAADRADDARIIRAELEAGTWVVCDRYVESNRAHQVARVLDPVKRAQLAKWITDTEYGVLKIPRADLTILLNVPVELCYQKAAERQAAEGGAKDILEEDKDHLRLAWEQYQELAKLENWPVVDCAKGMELLSREEIAAKIQKIVQEKLQFNR